MLDGTASSDKCRSLQMLWISESFYPVVCSRFLSRLALRFSCVDEEFLSQENYDIELPD